MSTATQTSAAVRELYATDVVSVGEMVPELMAGGVLVLFGEQAPAELHDISVLHRPRTALEAPRPGDVVELGGVALPVLAVGDVVAANLLQLGHLDLKADGRTTPLLPGDVCVAEGSLPDAATLQPGTVLRVLRPASLDQEARSDEARGQR